MMADQSQDAGQVDTLLEFPARFPIKVMGKNTAAFQAAVATIIDEFIAPEDRLQVHENLSKNHKYLAITVTAMFADKAAIDRVYQALSANREVIMAL